MAIELRPAERCEFDLVSLGECMLRLSPPGHERLEFAKQLEVWVGGAEYNVAYALARLGLRSAWIGGLVDNPLGRIIVNHARAVGLDLTRAVTLPYDDVGRVARIGLNFTEVGSGVRGSLTMYDRGHSATSKLKRGDIGWERLFDEGGVRWFHTGGTFTCLSASTAEVAADALQAAQRADTFVSYDLNYRSRLWSSEQARRTTRPLVQSVDCLIGNEEDFQTVLGYEVEGANQRLRQLPVESYKQMVRLVARDYPNLKLIGTTLREVVSGQINHWSAIVYMPEADTFYEGPRFARLEIEDRVGGGDGFAAGLAYGFLTGQDPQTCVNLGTAYGALLQSTRGDTSQITLDELERLAAGGSARIQR